MPVMPALRVAVLAMLTAAAVAAVGTGGCSNAATGGAPSASPSPAASPSPGPSPSPTPTPLLFVSLTYVNPSPAPTNDPTYGQVDGFGQLVAVPSPSDTPGLSKVLTIPANKTIQFYNFDTLSPHTASLLCPCPASGMNWPSVFNNTNGASQFSPPGSSISDPQFSTGFLPPASGGVPGTSLVYKTGAPGMYYFGDYYNYVPGAPGLPSMRTVIIVQ